MLGLNLVNELLVVFRHVGELAAIALPDILTSAAEPQSLIFKVSTLLGVEVSTVQIMLSPIIIIPLFGARAIVETQT